MLGGGEFGKDGTAPTVLQNAVGPGRDGLHLFEDRGREIEGPFAVRIAQQQMDMNGLGVTVHCTEPGRAGGELGGEAFGNGGKLRILQVPALLQTENDMPSHSALAMMGFREPLGIEADIVAEPVAEQHFFVGQVAHSLRGWPIPFDDVNDGSHRFVRAVTILAASSTAAVLTSDPRDARND